MTRSKPLLKWLGGKAPYAEWICSHMPGDVGGYLEAFSGGLAVYLHLRSVGRVDPERAVLSDINLNLVTTYREIQARPERVLERLRVLFDERESGNRSEREHFLAVREKLNRGISVAACMLYLNRCGFRGVYRENSSGLCNTSFGDGGDPRHSEERILDFSQALKGATLRLGTWQSAVECGLELSTVYFDPPYAPDRSGGFRSYSRSGFPWEEQVALGICAERLRGSGVRVLLSNHDLPHIRALYSNFEIYGVVEHRRVSVASVRRGSQSLLAVARAGTERGPSA